MRKARISLGCATLAHAQQAMDYSGRPTARVAYVTHDKLAVILPLQILRSKNIIHLITKRSFDRWALRASGRPTALTLD